MHKPYSQCDIKTFDDVARYVELEEDSLLANKPSGHVCMTESKRK